MTIPTEQGAEIGAVLGGLTAAGVPWLALALSGPAGGWSATAGHAAVIDLTDPHGPPVMVNPLEPERGYPVQAHADRLAGLVEAAFALPDPVATAIRTGLRRAYANSGWDALTGAVPPAVVAPAAVPAFHQLRHAVLAAAEDLGYDRSTRAAVRGFVQARLEPLWAGPAGRFLEGGHPADAGRLLKRNIVLLASGLADSEALFFLSGVLLIRVTETLRARGGNGPALGGHGSGPALGGHGSGPALGGHGSGPALGGHGSSPALGGHGSSPALGDHGSGPALGGHPGGELHRPTVDPRFAVVLTGPGPGPLAADWLRRVLEDLRAHGAEVVLAREPWVAAPTRAEQAVAAPGPGQVAQIYTQVLRGRRSAACGGQCTQHRPCDGYELSAADLLAHGDGQVWLRLWAQTLVLAFLTGRPLPRVPPELRSAWRALSPRSRECALATILDVAVATRATALRRYYDPRCLLSVAAAVAGRMLDGSAGVPFRAGQLWVIPQLRWLHETERLNPLGRDTIGLDDIAPPLDFGLAGLPDWPGIRVRDRLGGLQRHPLSMESARNRRSARIALLGEDGRGSFDVDLATAAIGLSAQARLRYAARMMGVGAPGSEPGWLEVVLSWPHRIIRPSWHADLSPVATG